MRAAKSLSPTPPARFGIFEFDTRTGELRRQGVRVRLCHQASQLLSFLLKAPGRIRTREELRRQLWPATTFVNFDHSTDGGAAGAAFVSGQIASRVTDGLAKISGLRVLACSTVKHLSSQQANPQRIGKQLDVLGVIFGELFWQNTDLLLHVELIDVADGSQIWGAQLEQKCDSLIECAEQFAQEILQRLQPILNPRQPAVRGQRLTSQPPTDS